MATDMMPRTPGTSRQAPGRATPPRRAVPPGGASLDRAPRPPAQSRARSDLKSPPNPKAPKSPKKPRNPRTRPVPAPRHTRPISGSVAAPVTKPVAAPVTKPVTKPVTRTTAGQRARPRHPRAPFILLLVGLLGGALISLLVISTMLAEGSFTITSLQQQDTNLARQEQVLTEQVAQDSSPAQIAQEAKQLGMRQDPNLRFINLKTGKIVSGRVSKADAEINVPGYAP